MSEMEYVLIGILCLLLIVFNLWCAGWMVHIVAVYIIEKMAEQEIEIMKLNSIVLRKRQHE